MTPPNRNGRPPLDRHDRSCSVNLTLPGKTYDELYARAQRQRVNVPELIRGILRRDRREHGDPETSDGEE